MAKSIAAKGLKKSDGHIFPDVSVYCLSVLLCHAQLNDACLCGLLTARRRQQGPWQATE